MIVLNHKKNKVQEIRILETAIAIRFKDNIAKQLFALAEFYPDELIIWCEETYKSELNVEQFPAIFHHQKMIHSFGSIPYLNDSIGFVENSPFIKIQPEVQYPTWQLSAEVGGMYASILNAVNKEAPRDKNFNYFLVSLGKLLQPQGVFCYSNPNLLLGSRSEIQNYSTTKELFQFVKQHYKFQWTFLLLFNCVYFKRQFPIFPFLKAMFYSRRKIKFLNLDNIPIESSNTLETNFSVDVVIPTMGRKSYLFDVLKDLANQTFLPENVIIIEQNPLQESESELEYINTESWPFTIKHTFIHQTGACNARNLGLKQVTSEWVFLADDDLRMEHNFLENVCVKVKDKQDSALTFSCLQKN
ncbi:MAG: glycosyltransferase family 2 protein, partial [Flavobacteriales bacterium]|nr:glycosyltransferase family 2 protein [Flavobacteriales bacterium]